MINRKSRILTVSRIMAVVLMIDVVSANETTTLFDGKTFDGWEGNLDIFRIEDGAIVGGTMEERIPHNDFLVSEAEYGDFEWTLRVKVKGPGNGGYQADMGWTFWGALYDESRRNRVLQGPDKELIDRILKKDDWNDYRIRCEGKRIRLWLNGELTVDYTEADDGIPLTGHLAVQIHGGAPSECWYKDIVIEELE